MSEQFTKGPWVAICPEQRLFVGESKEHDVTQYEVMSVKTRGELTMGGATHYRKDVDCVDNISIAQAYWRDMSDEEAKANAALIACAPEMYEMLKKVSQLIDNDGGAAIDWLIENTFDIRELLAKARGES